MRLGLAAGLALLLTLIVLRQVHPAVAAADPRCDLLTSFVGTVPPGLAKRCASPPPTATSTPTPLPTPEATGTALPTFTATPLSTSTTVPSPVPVTTSTATSTPTPPAPTPTATPPAGHPPLTSTPPSSPAPPALTMTPSPPPSTASDVPACAHDPRVWHGLVERNADGSIRCTYGHEHKDDPHALDYAFGPLPAYLGGDISYPWQTQNAATGALENDAKHRVYGWQVMDLPACVATGDSGFGFKRARLELHFDGPVGATTRYHSAWIQAEVCNVNDPAYTGFIERGGWLDTGSEFIDSPVCPGLQPVPVPGDNGPASVEQRLDGSAACPRFDSTWYARLGGQVDVFTGSIKEAWGAVDPQNPTGPLAFYGGTLNGSSQEPFHILSLFLDPTDLGDQRVTYEGFTDRYGAIRRDCTEVGLDCIPLRLTNIYGGVEYQFRNDASGLGSREYDVAGPDGRSLIQYPN